MVVLDSSALIAFFKEEPGADFIENHIAEAAVSAVNVQEVAKKMLDVAHSKHQAIAGNLANVETPGFKRQDIKADFAQELSKLAKTESMLSDLRNNAGGVQPGAVWRGDQ